MAVHGNRFGVRSERAQPRAQQVEAFLVRVVWRSITLPLCTILMRAGGRSSSRPICLEETEKARASDQARGKGRVRVRRHASRERWPREASRSARMQHASRQI